MGARMLLHLSSATRHTASRYQSEISSSTILTVASLVNPGTSLNLGNKAFLQTTWNKSIKLIKSPLLRTASLEDISFGRFLPQHIGKGDLHLHDGFGIAHKVAVYVLFETLVTDRWVW